MDRTQLLLLEIAKLAIDALGPEATPPPATEPGKPARRVKRKKRRKAARRAERTVEPEKPQGKNHRYRCTDCQTDFKSPDALLDATCPSCGGTHIEKRLNKNSTL